VFVRFTNKDHLIGASLRAAGLALVPLALLGMTGVVGDAVAWDPLWVTLAALAAASVPCLWVYLRWRL
jgi:hypothetical protein